MLLRKTFKMLKLTVALILITFSKVKADQFQAEFDFPELTFWNLLEEQTYWNLSGIIEFVKNPAFFGSDISHNCRTDFFRYLKGIIEGETWALAMFDSMEKFPSGILEGRKVIIGQYYECVTAGNENFTGQHCLVEIATKKNSVNFSTVYSMESGLQRLRENQFAYGLCIPSSCNFSELKNTFKALNFDKLVNFEINETSCTKGDFQSFRPEDWAGICFFVIVIFIVLASTAYDLLHKSEKNESQNKVLTSFSLSRNFKALFEINSNSSQINALHGIRFLSISWVVLGHFIAVTYHGSVSNYLDGLLLLNEVSAIPVLNGYFSVDSFFFLTGILVCFVFFREISKKGNYDAPVAIIQRYFRLTPTLAVMILIHTTFFSRIGTGPLWKMETSAIESCCRRNWWTDLLYINNYFPEPKKCLSQSWYLCADMQMFILAPFILYVVLFSAKLGPFYLATLIIGTSFISFITCYTNDLPPSMNMRINQSQMKADVMEYRQFQTRMTPWIIGIATGYIICGIQSKRINFKIPKFWIAVGWLISFALLLGSLYGIAAFIPVGSYHSPLEKSSYRAFSRVGWVLGLSWVVIACVSGYGGPINSFLSMGIFQPLSRLSYCIFLVHKSVQLFRISDSKDVKYITNLEMVYIFLGDLLISILLSVPMTLLFEMPITHLNKYFFENTKIFPYPRTPKPHIKNSAILFKD